MTILLPYMQFSYLLSTYFQGNPYGIVSLPLLVKLNQTDIVS